MKTFIKHPLCHFDLREKSLFRTKGGIAKISYIDSARQMDRITAAFCNDSRYSIKGLIIIKREE